MTLLNLLNVLNIFMAVLLTLLGLGYYKKEQYGLALLNFTVAVVNVLVVLI